MTPRAWAGSIAIATIVAASIVWAMSDTSRVEITTEEVTTGTVARTIVATGTLQAIRTVEVGTRISGSVASLEADFNSIVKQGQVLAHLDPSLYDAQVRQARANLAQAEASILVANANLASLKTAREDAQQKYSRTKALFDSKLLDAADYDSAKLALDGAEADVKSGESEIEEAKAAAAQARASVAQAEQNLSSTVIKSPIDGIIVDRGIDVGQSLAASIAAPEIFRVATDFKQLQLEVDVDESDVPGSTVGEPVSFVVEAFPTEMFSGTVIQVHLQPVAEQTVTATAVATSGNTHGATTAVASVVGYTLIIDVSNPDERLRPGMTATVSLGGTKRDNAVRIPNGALTFRPSPDLEARGQVAPVETIDKVTGGNALGGDNKPQLVWRYDGHRFVSTPVRTGLADQAWTEMSRGSLRPGDIVVTSAVVKKSSRLEDHLRAH